MSRKRVRDDDQEDYGHLVEMENTNGKWVVVDSHRIPLIPETRQQQVPSSIATKRGTTLRDVSELWLHLHQHGSFPWLLPTESDERALEGLLVLSRFLGVWRGHVSVLVSQAMGMQNVVQDWWVLNRISDEPRHWRNPIDTLKIITDTHGNHTMVQLSEGKVAIFTNDNPYAVISETKFDHMVYSNGLQRVIEFVNHAWEELAAGLCRLSIEYFDRSYKQRTTVFHITDLQTVFDRAGRPPPGSTVHYLHGLPHKKRKITASTDDNTHTLPIHYLNVTPSLRLPYAVERWIESFSPGSGREGKALRIWAWDPFQKEWIRAFYRVIFPAVSSRNRDDVITQRESVQYPETHTSAWKSLQLRYLAELQVSWPEFGPTKPWGRKYGARDDNDDLNVTLSMLQLWPSQADSIDDGGFQQNNRFIHF